MRFLALLVKIDGSGASISFVDAQSKWNEFNATPPLIKRRQAFIAFVLRLDLANTLPRIDE